MAGKNTLFRHPVLKTVPSMQRVKGLTIEVLTMPACASALHHNHLSRPAFARNVFKIFERGGLVRRKSHRRSIVDRD